MWIGVLNSYSESIKVLQSNLGNVITCQIEMPFKGQFFTSVMQAESMSRIVAISTKWDDRYLNCCEWYKAYWLTLKS